MAHLTTPLAGGLSQGVSLVRHSLLEAALVAAAIAVVLPQFAPLAADDRGRDSRFADVAVAVQGLPDPVLPDLCAAYGGLAEGVVRERLCPGADVSPVPEHIERLPRVLAAAHVRVRRAFLAPLEDAQARVGELRQQQREGLGDVHALGHAIDAAEAEMQPFIARYALSARDADGPRPLACAFEWTEAAIADNGARRDLGREMSRANAILLFGAALDGHPATGSAAAAAQPGTSRASGRCAGMPIADSLTASASIMADARAAPIGIAKNAAMRALLHTAGWQWAGWAATGLVLLNLARHRVPPVVGVAVALAAWAAAGWIGRVPWPFASDHALTLGRDSASPLAMPAGFVVWMLVASVMLLAISPWLRRALPSARLAPGSPFAYSGLVLATGIGWLLLLDLSAHAHFSNRYLALYHQGHLWLGMLVFTVVVFMRQPLGRGLAWLLSLIDGAGNRLSRNLGAVTGAGVLLLLALLFTVAMSALLLNTRQLTSEIGRLWLVVGAAWFFFLRGTPLTERLARHGTTFGSLARYVWPLLFVVIVLVGAMVVTRDMGPLLIACYAAGAFIAASVAMWRHQRTGATAPAYAIAILLFTCWIAATTLALFRFGAIDAVTAARLENTIAPLASANDQLAMVTWFQRAAPETGFGPAAVPWCGLRTSGACAGVPAQIQSDYTFTALVGMFGWTAAWALAIGCMLWLHTIIRPHGRATAGEPRMVHVSGRMANDDQAFVSWLCLSWVVLALCQLAVTVAGNLAVIPLTGVTFPFVSFGMTSLVVNMAMLGLALNVTTVQGAPGG